ncbi:MAG: ABC transporter ATP-binding protein [Anaerolineaceae bacterium]|nr:ABC transporter ATP-binding protein [Anaerolineaceae bacterium]
MFENVSKEFKLSKLRVRSLQEMFVSMFKRELRGKHRFWALKEVNFTINAGETVALVGTNGSGKSTALKLISRIIDPTIGTITVSGRLSALLELGAGFHPDLSGRENIFLNGSILGLGRQEMTKKLDAIIDFADIGEFIDVPIRNYSSGMQMRLGFSVAVHVEPQIILVDEVLAVGDHKFQLKCLKRIRQLQQKGVTILFVSHNFEDVRNLCSRAIWLDHGTVRADGRAGEILDCIEGEQDWNGQNGPLPSNQPTVDLKKVII